MQLVLRKCIPSDLDELLSISRKTFVDAFEKDNDPEDFETYIEVAFERTAILTQLNNTNSSFYFAYSEGYLTGYFKLNQNNAQTDIKSKDSVELERIYVLKEFQRMKIGEQMLHEAIKIASKRKKEYLWLGVWEKNIDAIRFYQKQGFSKFGTHPYYIGEDKQTDWLMRYTI